MRPEVAIRRPVIGRGVLSFLARSTGPVLTPPRDSPGSSTLNRSADPSARAEGFSPGGGGRACPLARFHCWLPPWHGRYRAVRLLPRDCLETALDPERPCWDVRRVNGSGSWRRALSVVIHIPRTSAVGRQTPDRGVMLAPCPSSAEGGRKPPRRALAAPADGASAPGARRAVHERVRRRRGRDRARRLPSGLGRERPTAAEGVCGLRRLRPLHREPPARVAARPPTFPHGCAPERTAGRRSS